MADATDSLKQEVEEYVITRELEKHLGNFFEAYKASKIADSKLTKSAQRLSSGKRINSGSDDAAGSAVGLKLHAQLQGQKAAIKTASDAISLLKLQEAGTSQFVIIHPIYFLYKRSQ